ncbi:MAG: hypothetical protein KAS07_01890 [Candidatus Pacebacteria bacterium]|nr:hypothetical protein [Candidatus Paceibacterota bacterium]
MSINKLNLNNKKVKIVLSIFMTFFLVLIIKTFKDVGENEYAIEELRSDVESNESEIDTLRWNVLGLESEVENHEHY